MFTTRCAASAITNPRYLTLKPFDKSLKALPDNSIPSYCGHSPLAKMISSVFFGKLPIDAKPQAMAEEWGNINSCSIANGHLGGVEAAGAVDAGAGVGGGARQIQTANRRPIAKIREGGTKEQLVSPARAASAQVAPH